MAAIRATGLVKHFGVRRALNGVDLTVAPGQLHGLLGPNGAGKTTLLRVLLGLVRREAGAIDLVGVPRPATGGPLPDGVAGFVDTPAFYPYLTGWQNLALMARLDGGAPSRRDGAMAEALERTGLVAHADEKVAGYSTGMRQRLGLAAALLRTPRLLILDEPTSSLDPAGARDVRALARELADDGATVLLSSHDLDEVEALCATVTVMNHGRVVFAGEVAELKRRGNSHHHYWLRTSHDVAAVAVARAAHTAHDTREVSIAPSPDPAGGLEVWASEAAMDAFVLALARAGVAVRALEPRGRSLESHFFALLERPESAASHMSALHAVHNEPQPAVCQTRVPA